MHRKVIEKKRKQWPLHRLTTRKYAKKAELFEGLQQAVVFLGLCFGLLESCFQIGKRIGAVPLQPTHNGRTRPEGKKKRKKALTTTATTEENIHNLFETKNQ